MPPSAQPSSSDAAALARELAWLETVISRRFAAHAERGDASKLKPPSLARATGPYAEMARDLDDEDRTILILAIAPCAAPALLDSFLLQNQATGRRCTEFGGVLGRTHAGFLPTAETAMFVLAGDDVVRRSQLYPRLSSQGVLAQRGWVRFERPHPEEPPLAAVLRLRKAALRALFGLS